MVDNVQKKLNDLRVAYSKSLPGKLVVIQNLWAEQVKHWEFEQFQTLHREVHSLCGSSGTYGFPDLSKAARQMEIFLKAHLEVPGITKEDQTIFNTYMAQLQSVLTLELSKNIPAFETKAFDNKRIYILEQDKALVQTIIDSLKQVDFGVYAIDNLDTLQMAVREIPPVAIIVDSFYLDKKGIEQLNTIQKEQQSPVQLFCFVPDAELMPRIKAIRVGCSAFFQKPLDVQYFTNVLNHKCSAGTGEPYRILIIDDSAPLAQYYSIILNQAGMTARAITNPLKLLEEMEAFQPNLLLMDIYMPECSGLELAAVLRQESSYTKTPIIFLSTEEDTEKKIFAISLGGDDYLTKPVSPQHLIAAVRSRSNRASILNYYMSTDSLTGLLNHSSILKQLEKQLIQAKENKVPVSFIMIDIDHFKDINDTYGHPAGDEVLKTLSNLFLTRLRSQDSVGRYGGEEFALILPNATLEDSRQLCEDLRNKFSQISFKANDDHFIATFSAGLACFDGKSSFSSLINQADQALYKAKELGRN